MSNHDTADETIGNQELIFENETYAPMISCRFEGCIVGGLGATREEAFRNFIRHINRLSLSNMAVKEASDISGKLPDILKHPIPGIQVVNFT